MTGASPSIAGGWPLFGSRFRLFADCGCTESSGTCLLGAHSGRGKGTIGACNVLGRLSYPLYILHYPAVYCFIDNAQFGHSSDTSLFAAVPVLFLGVLALGWAGLRLWGEPASTWLSRHLLGSKITPGS